MRYLDWDVLLFPEQSRIPLREFRTTCHVMYDLEPMQSQDTTPLHLSTNPVSQRQLPIVTCFVPNLPHGCPFRVSLHCWPEQPEVSRGTQALTSSKDSVFFETRVLLDGVHVGGLLLDNLGPWPQAIDTCSKLDTTGNQECLRFPPFHHEMLMHDWWSAGEDLGRIKVVITEGLAHGKGQATVFRRVKNVVLFSFQHAPLAVLEDAGIAWPNAGMWHQTTQQIYTPSSPSRSGATDPDAHAHSPRRRRAFREPNQDAPIAIAPVKLLSQASMPPPTLRNAMAGNSNWTTVPLMQDLCFEGYRQQVPRRFATRVSTSDQSMPDYSHSITPRSSRDPSLQTMQIDGTATQHESQFEELMAAFSPAKASGTQAPPTTRVSSATNSPLKTLKPVSDAEVRITSYHGQPRAVSMTTREVPPSSARVPTDVSMKSRISESQAEEKEKAHPKIKVAPATEIKGRKEGKSSEVNPSKLVGEKRISTGSNERRVKDTTHQNEDHDASANECKRKRASMTSIMNVLAENSEGPDSSPSRKVSKKGRKDGLDNPADSSKSPESTMRAPLGTLQNIQ